MQSDESGSGSVIQDHSDHGASKELIMDLSVPLMHYYPSDLGSLILIKVAPTECTLYRHTYVNFISVSV